MMLSVAQIIVSNDRMIVKDVKVSGCSLLQGTILRFTWRDLRKPQKPSVRIANLCTKIWTWDLPNMKQEC
jgi:hypothetical protein